MAQERNEQKAACGVAVQSLKKELSLAIQLLLQVKEARETVAIEHEALETARGAFRHAAEALQRMPQITPEDMRDIEELMDEFRRVFAKIAR